jgi:hypothetical protein
MAMSRAIPCRAGRASRSRQEQRRCIPIRTLGSGSHGRHSDLSVNAAVSLVSNAINLMLDYCCNVCIETKAADSKRRLPCVGLSRLGFEWTLMLY